MDPQLIAALLLGKTVAFINKLTGSGATAAPGLYALKIDPNLVKKLSKKIKNGPIVISGTNGKTTTSRLIFDILSTKYKIIHNRQGSNLLRGIASTLIKHTSIFGNLDSDLAIWEVDEATLPEAIKNVNPKVVVLLNLFRDQLDRYGEVDTTRTKWQDALLQLSKESTLVLNTDDPNMPTAAKFSKAKSVYFGVEDTVIKLPSISHVADVKYCPRCQSKLVYEALFSSHLGHYKCSNCDFQRPDPSISASSLIFNYDFSTRLKLTINYKPAPPNKIKTDWTKQGEPLTINYKLPGLYNVYNILAASCVARLEKINVNIIKKNIEEYSSAFGRSQFVSIPVSQAGGGNKSVIIFLIKNPTGANEVLRVLSLRKSLHVLAILNDKIADGRDVSWIWDTNWEILQNKITTVSVSGTRAWDIATRLKYAGIKLSKNNIYMGNHIPHKYRNKEISYSVKNSIDKLNNRDTLIILPTYTAMLEVQRTLHKVGASRQWHRQ